MKRLLVLFASLLTLSSAALARNSWQGQAMVTAVPAAACAADGQTIGQFLTTIFLPSGISDNGTDSYLTFYTARHAYSIAMTGRPVAGVAYRGIRINTYGKHSTAPPGTIVSATIAPATILATTPFVDFTIRISNWDSTIGCTATLQGSMVLRR